MTLRRPRWCRRASCPILTTPGCREPECNHPPSRRRRPPRRAHRRSARPKPRPIRLSRRRLSCRRRSARAPRPQHHRHRYRSPGRVRRPAPTPNPSHRPVDFACPLISPLHWRAVMITLDHVTKQYKSSARPALDDINVKIDKGEFVFLIGPSGSGKSTFMRRCWQRRRRPVVMSGSRSFMSTNSAVATYRSCVR